MTHKKIICIALAVIFVVAVSAIAIHASDFDLFSLHACCDNYRGTSERVLSDHVIQAGGCTGWFETYCASCGTVFDTWYGYYNICPH